MTKASETTRKFVDVYIPVCVTIEVDDNQQPIAIMGAQVDYEGAPWIGIDNIEDVYDHESGNWLDHAQTEDLALWAIDKLPLPKVEYVIGSETV